MTLVLGTSNPPRKGMKVICVDDQSPMFPITAGEVYTITKFRASSTRSGIAVQVEEVPCGGEWVCASRFESIPEKPEGWDCP